MATARVDALGRDLAFYERFASLPCNKAYLEGDAHALPCNNKMASLGGS